LIKWIAMRFVRLFYLSYFAGALLVSLFNVGRALTGRKPVFASFYRDFLAGFLWPVLLFTATGRGFFKQIIKG